MARKMRRENSKSGGHRGNGRSSESHQGELLYGRQPVREMFLAERRRVFRLYLSETVKPTAELNEILSMAGKADVMISRLSVRELDALVGDVNHQGIIAAVDNYPYLPFDKLLEKITSLNESPPLLLLLDHLEDPQNVGSLIRSAETAGVDGVIIPDRRAASITPAVVRASAGATEHVRVTQVTNLARTIETLKKDGFWFAGLEATDDAKPHTQTDLTGSLGLVVGSEGSGIKRIIKEHCDYLIKLPLKGKIGSLNAGVSGAIALYEILRQREKDCLK